MEEEEDIELNDIILLTGKCLTDKVMEELIKSKNIQIKEGVLIIENEHEEKNKRYPYVNRNIDYEILTGEDNEHFLKVGNLRKEMELVQEGYKETSPEIPIYNGKDQITPEEATLLMDVIHKLQKIERRMKKKKKKHKKRS